MDDLNLSGLDYEALKSGRNELLKEIEQKKERLQHSGTKASEHKNHKFIQFFNFLIYSLFC
jgi:hypothetical protein